MGYSRGRGKILSSFEDHQLRRRHTGAFDGRGRSLGHDGLDTRVVLGVNAVNLVSGIRKVLGAWVVLSSLPGEYGRKAENLKELAGGAYLGGVRLLDSTPENSPGPTVR